VLLYGELPAAIGLTLAPQEPRAAATAILRIERLAAEPCAKPLSMRGIGKTEDVVRHIVPPHRTPARTDRKPTAEFADDKAVLAHELIGGQRNLIQPFVRFVAAPRGSAPRQRA